MNITLKSQAPKQESRATTQDVYVPSHFYNGIAVPGQTVKITKLMNVEVPQPPRVVIDLSVEEARLLNIVCGANGSATRAAADVTKAAFSEAQRLQASRLLLDIFHGLQNYAVTKVARG